MRKELKEERKKLAKEKDQAAASRKQLQLEVNTAEHEVRLMRQHYFAL